MRRIASYFKILRGRMIYKYMLNETQSIINTNALFTNIWRILINRYQRYDLFE